MRTPWSNPPGSLWTSMHCWSQSKRWLVVAQASRGPQPSFGTFPGPYGARDTKVGSGVGQGYRGGQSECSAARGKGALRRGRERGILQKGRGRGRLPRERGKGCILGANTCDGRCWQVTHVDRRARARMDTHTHTHTDTHTHTHTMYLQKCDSFSAVTQTLTPAMHTHHTAQEMPAQIPAGVGRC